MQPASPEKENRNPKGSACFQSPDPIRIPRVREIPDIWSALAKSDWDSLKRLIEGGRGFKTPVQKRGKDGLKFLPSIKQARFYRARRAIDNF